MGHGRFTIQEILGAGAFAVVCTARDLSNDREVALKVLRGKVRSEPGAVWRLRDEGRILRQLSHPVITRCHEICEYSGTPVLVLERIRGLSLDRLLEAGPVPAPESIALGKALAEGLQHGWEAPGEDGAPMRIVHRDLKPHNVLLASNGAVKLIDFGIAKGDFAGREARSLFFVQGSAGYDAPERRESGDHQRVDVYGLGALLLTLLTGYQPLLSTGDGRPAELQAHLERVEHGESTDALRELLSSMLSAEPQARPEMWVVSTALGELVKQVDLAALAQQRIAPLLARAEVADPKSHDCWGELRFLEEVPPGSPDTLGDDDVVSRLVAFLAEPGWEERVTEIEAVLAKAGFVPVDPLLAVLERAEVPWYKPWGKPATPAELEAALLLLCDHADERVVARTRALIGHEDHRVQAAARFLLGMHPVG